MNESLIPVSKDERQLIRRILYKYMEDHAKKEGHALSDNDCALAISEFVNQDISKTVITGFRTGKAKTGHHFVRMIKRFLIDIGYVQERDISVADPLQRIAFGYEELLCPISTASQNGPKAQPFDQEDLGFENGKEGLLLFLSLRQVQGNILSARAILHIESSNGDSSLDMRGFGINQPYGISGIFRETLEALIFSFHLARVDDGWFGSFTRLSGDARALNLVALRGLPFDDVAIKLA